MKAAVVVTVMCAFALTAARAAPEAGTLIVFRLSVESSYADNVERPAGEQFDTIQWWIGQRGAWRIKTYATDHDIHPYWIDTEQTRDALKGLAYSNSKKTYGDVISSTVTVEIPAGISEADLAAHLRSAGLSERFEWVDAGYLLWLPDGGHYKTKTKPKSGEPDARPNAAEPPPRSGSSPQA